MSVIKLIKEKENTSGENVIKRIEEVLEKAKAGELNNIIIVASTNKEEVIDCWANGNDPFRMVGALESVKLEFMAALIERRDL